MQRILHKRCQRQFARFMSGPAKVSMSSGKIVNSHTEWETLEEVIVGRAAGATMPKLHTHLKAVVPPEMYAEFEANAGKPFPKEIVDAADKELDYLQHVLEQEGVVVQRPDVMEGDFSQPYKTPDWEEDNGLYAAMPRDILITVGNEIIEAPMAWRSRFFEYRPYRRLIKEYFMKGGGWTAAPKGDMSDKLYNENWCKSSEFNSVVTEHEPCFDAADFTRIGTDIFAQRSHVTNMFGIEWMRRHLATIDPRYKIHVLDFQDRNGMHIDGTFIPLGEGKILANPKRPCVTGDWKATHFTFNGKEHDYMLPKQFKGWDVFIAPTPMLPANHPLYFTSPWTATANVLLLGENRVLVEAQETETMKAFESWGFKPIPIPFRNFLPLGGSFHCATCDVRRAGSLKSYLGDFDEYPGPADRLEGIKD